MKTLLRLEELAQFLLIVVLLIMKSVAWWWYVLLVIGPDIGMLGYLKSPRWGATTYNLLHHKGIALLVVLIGFVMELANMLTNLNSAWLLAGLVLFGHASMDRALGYGLKFNDSFHHTHLGWIKKDAEPK
jgi:Domain of unknown function (DUF4260)